MDTSQKLICRNCQTHHWRHCRRCLLNILNVTTIGHTIHFSLKSILKAKIVIQNYRGATIRLGSPVRAACTAARQSLSPLSLCQSPRPWARCPPPPAWVSPRLLWPSRRPESYPWLRSEPAGATSPAASAAGGTLLPTKTAMKHVLMCFLTNYLTQILWKCFGHNFYCIFSSEYV